MTTKPTGSTMPNYGITFISKSYDSNPGVVVTESGSLLDLRSWRYAPAYIEPVNLEAPYGTYPVDFTVRGQSANSSMASAGGNIVLAAGASSIGSSPAGNVIIRSFEGSGGSAGSTHLVMGEYHIWVDNQGRLRIKNGPPSLTDVNDGTIVGTQS